MTWTWVSLAKSKVALSTRWTSFGLRELTVDHPDSIDTALFAKASRLDVSR
jgi:hypothetical protein